MVNASRLGAMLVALALPTSCGTPPPPKPQDLISTALVVNSVKCGFALALVQDRALSETTGYTRLKGNVATFQLQLKVATTNTAGVGASGVIPFQGGSLLPSFSHSNSQAWTVDTIINASYRLDAENAAVCAAADIQLDKDGRPHDPYGFTEWLSNILFDLSKVSLEGPTGRLEKLTYDATIGLTKSTEGKLGLKLAFLDANASGKIDRVDTQHLIIVISGTPAVPAKPSKPNQPATPATPPGDLGPFREGDAQNLSTVQPADD